MMADVEPIPWQMLLPMFNSVADAGTTYWLIISQILDFLWQMLLPLWQMVKPLIIE